MRIGRGKRRGWIAGAVAFVSCPCHLPLTLPLLIGLSGGTVLGAWLTRNTTLIFAISTVIFLGGLVLVYRWVMRPKVRIPARSGGRAEVVLITSTACTSCGKADRIWRDLQRDHRFRYRRVDIRSEEGHSLAAAHRILSTPTTLIDGQVAFRGVPNRRKASLAVR